MHNSLTKIHSFPPIINATCTRLILGSIPGVASLEKQEYYGYPHNIFWRILFALYHEPLTDDYDEKRLFLLSHHIALWDVIGSCRREGSLDSRIKDAFPNDFASLFRAYPCITRVYFNGEKAYTTYQKKVGFDVDRAYFRLPSTSPAHAVAFENKLDAWRAIL